MAIAHVATGASSIYTGSSVTPALPASLAAEQMLLLPNGMRPDSSTMTHASGDAYTLPTNGEATGGAGSEGAGSGTALAQVWWRLATGSESAGPTMATTFGGGGPVGWAAILSFSKDAVKSWATPVMARGSLNTGGSTAISCAATDTIQVEPGDVIVVTAFYNFNTPTFASHALAATGITFDTAVEIADSGSSTGNDMRRVVTFHEVLTGSDTVTLTYTGTASTSNANGPAGAFVFTRLREVSSASPIVVPQTIAVMRAGNY